MKHPRKASGFTLLELLVVVIIVGILATIAIPGFVKLMERVKGSEATSQLGTMYLAERVYYQDHDKYVPVLTDIGFDAPVAAQSYFTYSVTSATATQFTGAAVRRTAGGKPPNYSPAYTWTIDETNTLAATGP